MVVRTIAVARSYLIYLDSIAGHRYNTRVSQLLVLVIVHCIYTDSFSPINLLLQQSYIQPQRPSPLS
jgi:hypothetical protein